METIQLVLSLVGTIGCMIGIFFLAFWFTKVVGRRAQGGLIGNDAIQVLAKLPLEKEQSLLIVQAAEKAFLVGVTEKSMTAIGELDPSLIPEPVGTEANGTFFTSMQEAWGKLREPPKKGGRIP